jgi:hypothetical protein
MNAMENTNNGQGRYVTEAMYLADRLLLHNSMDALRASVDNLAAQIAASKPQMAVEQYKDERAEAAKMYHKDKIWAAGLIVFSALFAAALGAFLVSVGFGS